VGGLRVVGDSSIFGLVRRTGVFTGGLLTFDLVSGLQLAQHNRGQYHFCRAAFSSQLETMVGGSLPRSSALCVVLDVGRSIITSGSHTHPSHSCDGWVCDLGVVGVSSIFGLVRRAGAFAGGLLAFDLVSGLQLTRHNRGQFHFHRAAFSSQLEGGNGRWCPDEGFGFACWLGCRWAYHCVWITHSSITFVDFSFVDLVFFFRCF
jgi:hypothetical protein